MKNYAKAMLPLFIILSVLSCTGTNKSGADKVETSTLDSTNDSATRARTAAAATDLTVDEKEFVLRAATGGMMEVEAGKVAFQKTRNEGVKDFADRIVKDHELANRELYMIAKAKGISPATSLPEDLLKKLENLKELSDRPFDVQYVKMMIEDHNKTLILFNNGIGLANPQLKAFAQKYFPIIKKHHEIALKLGKTLNIKNVNLGDDVLNISPTDDDTH